MDIDSLDTTLRQKSDSLKTLSQSTLPSTISSLSQSSRAIPSEKDFHFYYNFDSFRSPLDDINAKSHSMLSQIGHLWGSGKQAPFPSSPADVEVDSCDWLVNLNDEVLERFDVSLDEFSKAQKAAEESARGRTNVVDESGFQLVYGRKKKEESGVRVAERGKKGKQKVPFHIPTIRRPQDEFNILVNNSNQPFQHVWLERSEDDDESRFIHPLEKLSVSDFVDKNVESLVPMEPPGLESTPFKMVQDVKDLKVMAAKLRSANEIAVDLEHNQYRSFQGLTCLMQISTRTEDFVVDTLKLRIQIGPYLREIFKDPAKKKVMHGADRDIAWLQRDFGIYVCNLFDTGQASRVLQLERNSLEYLLQHFCGVTANKEYQNADWRLRPLPEEMIRYAREDTHYLLYIYDLMRIRLFSECADPDNPYALLQDVYNRSYDLCMQLYEKELLTDTSYLYIYGVQGANLNAQQLSVVAGLCEWRDAVAREEDESTGYILPNKLLLEIGKQMPVTTNKLRWLVKSKHPYVERNLSSVVNIIRHCVQNYSAFEGVAEQLKEGHIQAPESIAAEDDFPELQTAGDNSEGFDGIQNEHASSHLLSREGSCKFAGNEANGQNGTLRVGITEFIPGSHRGQLAFSHQSTESTTSAMHSGKAVEATVQVLKKPCRAFGALLGSSASKKRSDLKGENKLEHIKSSVNLPFYSFSQGFEASKQAPKPVFEDPNKASATSVTSDRPFDSASTSKAEDIILLDGDQALEEPNATSESVCSEDHPDAAASHSQPGDVILLDSDSDDDEEPADSLAGDENHVNTTDQQAASEPELVVLDEDEDENEDNQQMSLSDLSSNFQKCLQPIDQDQTSKHDDNSDESGRTPFKPFDYEAARKQIQIEVDSEKRAKNGDGNSNNFGKKKSNVAGRGKQEEGLLPQGKRRQAFPTSGNRSATFR